VFCLFYNKAILFVPTILLQCEAIQFTQNAFLHFTALLLFYFSDTNTVVFDHSADFSIYNRRGTYLPTNFTPLDVVNQLTQIIHVNYLVQKSN